MRACEGVSEGGRVCGRRESGHTLPAFSQWSISCYMCFISCPRSHPRKERMATMHIICFYYSFVRILLGVTSGLVRDCQGFKVHRTLRPKTKGPLFMGIVRSQAVAIVRFRVYG